MKIVISEIAFNLIMNKTCDFTRKQRQEIEKILVTVHN